MKTFREFLIEHKTDEHITAASEIVSFTNKNGKKFTYPIEDLRRCLEALWLNGKTVDKILNNDWSYEESKFRRAFSSAFVDEGNNTVTSNLGSQTPNTVRCLELYAYFLLDEKPTPKLEKPEILNGMNLDGIFYGDDRGDEFREWLRNEKQLSEKSAESYTGAISGLLSEIVGKSLLRISSAETFDLLRNAILKRAEFIKYNTDGNQMYSAALNHYLAFLKQRNGKRPQRVDQVSLTAISKDFSSALQASGFNVAG